MPTNTANKRRSLAKDQTRLRIEKMEAEREERRRAMKERKRERAEEEQRLIAAGNPGDVDFIGMVRKWRDSHSGESHPHEVLQGGHPRICICVRKRPISDKERKKNDHDSVTCLNPLVWIHSAKFRVDGITKYLDHTSFKFDHSFDENVSTEDVYKHTTMPLLDFVCSGTGGRATVFAYGQTGSGKTYTMNGIQNLLCEDLFLLLSNNEEVPGMEDWCSLEDTNVTVSFFELYGGYVQDLLNKRKRLKLLEDGKGEVVITGLEEFDANSPEEFQILVEAGNNERTTHSTEANDTSSRSHAICQIQLRDKRTSKLKGKFSLVDLAGSERGTDTKSHNSQRRTESADINTSLLSLKECIRALGMNKSGCKHVPYRGSKLTLILKDCFTSSNAKTTMIATISPGASGADHTLNTLRYANRIKEQRVGEKCTSKLMDRSFQYDNISTRCRESSCQSHSFLEEEFEEEDHPTKSHVENTNALASSFLEDDFLSDDDLDDNPSTQTNIEQEPSKMNLVSQPTSLLQDEFSKDENSLMSDDDLQLCATEETMAESEPSNRNHDRSNNQLKSNRMVDDDPSKDAAMDYEAELRAVVKAMFEQEEVILNLHMANIQENAELLTEEGKMLQEVQRDGVSKEDIDLYMLTLSEILDRKEYLIRLLQEKVDVFRTHLKREQDLSKKVEKVSHF